MHSQILLLIVIIPHILCESESTDAPAELQEDLAETQTVPAESYEIPIESYGPPKPYSFGYKVHDKDGDQWRQENSDGLGKIQGSYGYIDNHGMQREVHYVADDEGFRARIKTNEPGMDVPNPADVVLEANPPSDYDASVYGQDATIYGVEDLGEAPKSNLVSQPLMKGPLPKGFYKYQRFAEPSVPPVYVVDGHLQSPWFPMDSITII